MIIVILTTKKQCPSYLNR